MKKYLVLVLTVVLAFMFVSCGNDEKGEAAGGSENSNEQKEVVEETKEVVVEPTEKVISFVYNEENKEVTIPHQPKRIVVIGFDMLDIVEALGHKDKVVGTVDPASPLFPSYLEGYEDVTSVGSLRGDDLEAIAALKPDVIIAGARTFKAYDSLNEIAPTVWYSIPGMGTAFEEKLYSNIDAIANILNEQEKAEEIKLRLTTKIDTVQEKIGSIEDSSALFLIVTGKTIKLYSDDVKSRYGFVFNEFGFKSPVSAEEIENDAATHGNSISFEFISAKNPNYMIVIDKGVIVGDDEVLASDTLDNDLVKSTDAYKNDNIMYLDGVSWYIATGGIKATEIMVDSILDELK